MITTDQLRFRLFALSAARGAEWGLTYTEDIMRRFGENAWVFSCGAEMLLRNQLPERAESLEETFVDPYREFACGPTEAQEAQEAYEAECLWQGKVK